MGHNGGWHGNNKNVLIFDFRFYKSVRCLYTESSEIKYTTKSYTDIP